MNNHIFKRYKNIFLSLLFFSMMYSISHALVYEAVNDDCTSSIEYIVEYENPTEHNDLCDTHHEFHKCYTMNHNDFIFKIDFITQKINNVNPYIFKLSEYLLKPPIA